VRTVDAAGAVLRLSRRDGVPPSCTEVAAELHVTRGAAVQLLTRARKAGLVRSAIGSERATVAIACRCAAPATWRPVRLGPETCGTAPHPQPRVARDGVCVACRGVVLLGGRS
jgi:hypothetical protein